MKKAISLFLNEKFKTHMLLITLSGLCSITLVNILFPLVKYTKYLKISEVSIAFLLTTILFYFLYFHFIKPILSEPAKTWLRNILIAAAMTGLLLSLSPQHLPYHPVEYSIQITTNSPNLGFSHVARDIEGGASQIIKAENFKFSGAWNHGNGYALHQGNQLGEINYQGIEYVRSSLTYKFAFMPQNQPTSATILIDDESHFIEIAPSSQENQSYGVTIDAPEKPSSSRFWQLWMLVFPYFSALTLLTIVFFGVSILLSKHKTLIDQIVHLLLFFVFLYLFWLTLNYQNNLFNYGTFRSAFPFIALIFFILFPFLINLLLKKHPHSKTLLLFLIILFAIGLRVYWIAMVPTEQVSDFGRFHRWALQLAAGEPGLTMDRYTNFTRLLSLLYRVFPTDNAVEVLNILYSLGTMLCLYWIGRANQQEEAGVIAAYLFAVFPSQICMVSMVNTDIPSIFFLTLSVCLSTYFVHSKKLFYLFLSAASFGISYIVRGALLIYFPVILLPFVFDLRKKFFSNLLWGGVVAAGFVVAIGVLNGVINQVKVQDMVIEEGRYLMWPLLKGTNIEKLGRNNDEDTSLVAHWPVEDVNRNGLKVVAERVFSDPLKFYSILDDKFEFQFADATYGANLAFYDETHEYFDFKTGWNYPIEDVREGFAQLAQYAYLTVLLAAILASLRTDRSQWMLTLPVLVILLCALGGYTFFEVQPRYSRPIIPFVILMAGLFFTNCSKPLVNEAIK